MNHDSTRPQLSVEQLLRLKRTEKPAPEFWQQFEREMRIKQLAAIVEPRPWWAPFIRVGTRVARYQLPVGATAILALTFITIREYRLPEAEVGFTPEIVATKIDTMPGPAVPTAANDRAIAAEASLSARPAAPAAAPASADADRSRATPEQVAGMVSMLGGPEVQSANATEYSPAARAIAANLAAVKASAPELVQMIDRVSGVDELMSPPARTQAVDPLSRIQSPGESRRTARLLASALPAVSYSGGDDGSRVTADRIERSLTEERLYDSVSRFGVKADRVAIKF